MTNVYNHYKKIDYLTLFENQMLSYNCYWITAIINYHKNMDHLNYILIERTKQLKKSIWKQRLSKDINLEKLLFAFWTITFKK